MVKPFSRLRVAVLRHQYSVAGGMAQELVDYLAAQGARVLSIGHPFPRATMALNSTLQIYEQGRVVRELKSPVPRGPDILFYLADILFTLYFLLRTRTRVDLLIGLDNLNTFTGLVLKRLGLVRAVVFYVIDYVPQRFENRRLNALYHWIDKFCCYHSDCIWNVSGAMMDARRTAWGSLDGVAPSLVVPLGCNFERVERLPLAQIDRHTVVFIGHLVAEQGIRLLLETWPAVCARVPEAKLVIVGGGALEAELRERVKQLGLEASVHLTGFVAKDTDAERILSHCAIGVAPYTEEGTSFKYYADPGKVKVYLAAGLPVVITKVPPVARVIHAAQAGFAIQHDACELTEALVTLLTQDDVYARYRENAIQLGAQFSWNRIFGDALARTPGVAQSE